MLDFSKNQTTLSDPMIQYKNFYSVFVHVLRFKLKKFCDNFLITNIRTETDFSSPTQKNKHFLYPDEGFSP